MRNFCVFIDKTRNLLYHLYIKVEKIDKNLNKSAMKSVFFTLKPIHALNLPFAHFKTLQGLAYSLMSFDEKLAEEVHDRRFPDKKAFKFFCFSDLNGRYVTRNGGLIYRDLISWELRSADDRIIDAAVQAVSNDPLVTINRQPCEVLFYEIRSRHFCADAVNFQMNTPIVIYHTEQSGFVRYYNPFEQEFFERISKNLQNKFEMFCEKPLPGSVIIECNAPLDKDKCVTHYEDSIITAWYGNYRVTAPPEVLDFIWHTGLGGKNSMGFGTVSELRK